MQLEWSNSNTEAAPQGVLSQDTQHILHVANCQSNQEPALKHAVIDTAHKAAQLLVDNIEDDSLYLMFIWNSHESTLTVVVTDDTKSRDAVHVVRCAFPVAIEKSQSLGEPFSSFASYWIRDYLTTSSDYMKFSMVATFADGSRDVSNML